MREMNYCNLCPRSCGVDRTLGGTGFCGMSDQLKIARAALHYWEEPCISGTGPDGGRGPGSGTVFFSGCNLRCVYCQNHDISSQGFGACIDTGRLTEIFFELKAQGAVNINLVTPTHYIPPIVTALERARAAGLNLPIVWNTGGYESVEGLKMLEGLVDIYLPDFKYMDEDRAELYSAARDYPAVAKAALGEMFRQVGEPVFDEAGLMKRGMIVRHLLLPGGRRDSMEVLRYLYETYGDGIYISIMSQYTPLPEVLNRSGGRVKFPELYRRVSPRSYDRLVEYALGLGITNAFIQEGDAAEESFIPPFTLTGVLKKEESHEV